MPGYKQGKPIFGFLWSGNKPVSPNQARYFRVNKRGLLRLAVLVTLTLLLTFFAVTSLTYLINAQPSLLEAIVMSVLVATASVAIFRSWTLGTYVNDRGIKIVKLFTTEASQWSSIQRIECETTTWSLLGVPIGLKSPRILVHLTTGEFHATHLFIGSIDGIFTATQLETVNSLILRWFRSE